MGNLVLSRREGEKVLIDTKDGRIVLEVMKVKSAVKLAILAPRSVVVLREELATKGCITHEQNDNHLR